MLTFSRRTRTEKERHADKYARYLELHEQNLLVITIIKINMMIIKISYTELFLCDRPYAKVFISFLPFVPHINIIRFIVLAQYLVLLFFILIGLLNVHWTHCFLKLKLHFFSLLYDYGMIK